MNNVKWNFKLPWDGQAVNKSGAIQNKFKLSVFPFKKTCYYFQMSTSKADNVKTETWRRNYQTRLLGAVSMNKTHHVFLWDESDRNENTREHIYDLWFQETHENKLMMLCSITGIVNVLSGFQSQV